MNNFENLNRQTQGNDQMTDNIKVVGHSLGNSSSY